MTKITTMDKTRHIFGRIILLLPLILSFAWFFGLVANVANISANSPLSPSKLNLLITVLFAFILCYGAFLFFEIYRQKKSLKTHKKAKVF